MISYIAPILSSFFSALQSQNKKISDQTGIDENIVRKVTSAVEAYLTEDERLMKLSSDMIDKARQHDISTFNKEDMFANRLRSLVRPVTTFVALFWYVYARVNAIPLVAEDYAIVGGVLAFWFGFRPFEKKI